MSQHLKLSEIFFLKNIATGSLILTVMKSLFLFLPVIVVFLSSCREKSPGESSASNQPRAASTEDSLFHEVLKGHDEGMAKISRIRKYSSRLNAVIDSIKTNSIGNKSELSTLQRVKDSLDAANAAMFTWMDGFKADTLTGMGAERIRYLHTQKASVTIVRDQIKNSLRLYDSLDKKYH